MKIVIAGAYEVGKHLAKLLAKEDMDVVLMDADPNRIKQLTYINLMTMVGAPTSIQALRDAGVPRCDLFIAVTPNESVNVHACILAANLGARRTMARVDTYEMQKPENADFYSHIGISRLVYPEKLGGEYVAAAIKRPWARQSFSLCRDRLLLVGVKVREGAPIVGQSLMEIGRQHHDSYHVAAIIRDDDLLIPVGTDCVKAGDLVYFVTTNEKADVVRSTCGKKERHLDRVIVLGADRLGIQACYNLPKNFKVVFIEPNEAKANMATEKIPNSSAVNGLKGDVDTLKELSIGEHDAFVAVGPNADSNILSCLNAKKLGVGKTVVEVSDVEQITMAQNLNIGSVVNKKLLTASFIHQLLLDEDKTNAKCYSLVDAEVAELEVQPGSRVTKSVVMHLSLPKGITLGGMVRDGKGQTITGQTQLQAGDHVVVICLNEKLGQIEKYFV